MHFTRAAVFVVSMERVYFQNNFCNKNVFIADGFQCKFFPNKQLSGFNRMAFNVHCFCQQIERKNQSLCVVEFHG